jgi:membrane protein insertase Oxa1/YidC/SpoIIIJ
VYWATSNLFRLGQQIAIVRIDGRLPQAGDQQVEQNEKEKPAAPKSQGSAKKRQRRRRK